MAAAERLPPVRAVTRGPQVHWFGYYDKPQFDPAGRLALAQQGEREWEKRGPQPNDVVRIGLIDLRDNDRWTDIGETRAWNWQQGSMLQWLPGSDSKVIWNDREDGPAGRRFVSRVLDVKTGRRDTLPAPVETISPDGRWALTTDFPRLQDLRPVCGYAGVPDPNRGNPAPAEAGITKLDLRTGELRLILSLADVVKHGPGRDLWDDSAQHFFQHVLFSPDGSRFIFLHRWRGKKEGQGFATRMFTASADGHDLHVMSATGKTSHFCWRDPGHVLAWALHPSRGARFYVFKDRSGDPPVPLAPEVLTEDGHCTYLPDPGATEGGRWVLSDTYPDRDRNQHPYLFDVKTSTRHPLGHFASPPMYTGDIRCDTHPRSSPDGKQVMIDSPHGGEGRQMYLVDVSEVLSRASRT